MAIKFQTHIPQTLYFPYGDFMEVSGQYGAQFLYTVESEGQRERLYATPRLHQDLQEAGVSSGDLATITKIEVEGNRMAWKVEVEGVQGPDAERVGRGDCDSAAVERTETNCEKSSEEADDTRRRANGHSQRSAPPEFAAMEQMLHRCLRSSWQAWQRLEGDIAFSSEDVRNLGITLFLECSRKGVSAQEQEVEQVAFDR
jgi:hypothetical protein